MSGKNPIPTQDPLVYEGANLILPSTGFAVIKAKRDPTTNDKKYPVPSLWVNTVLENIWIQTAPGGQWTEIIESGAVIVDVPNGGTGVVTLAANGVLVGAGTSDVVVTAAGTNGQVLVAATGAPPAFATLTSANSSVTFTTGANTLALAVTQATTVQVGGGETATDAEAISAASTTVLLTPSNLAAVTATNLAGLSASNSATRVGTSTAAFTTPANIAALNDYMDVNVATQNPILQTILSTGGVPTGATGDTNIISFKQGWHWEQFILGAGQTIIAPRVDANGLLISLDLTNTEGAEYNSGARSNSPFSFTIGTSAAFFLEVPLYSADVSGASPLLIGFRKVEANNATFTNYTDYASIGLSAADGANIWLRTRLNSGAETKTDTTNTWTDGLTKTLRINVSGAGVVTYTIGGAPPSVTAAFTFDVADVVIPFIRLTHGAAAPGAMDITGRMKCGLQ